MGQNNSADTRRNYSGGVYLWVRKTNNVLEDSVTESSTNPSVYPKISLIIKFFLSVLIITFLFLIRWTWVSRLELPTGDDVNVYIRSAQDLASQGCLPPLREHPGTAVVYAAAAKFLQFCGKTLPYVRASYIVSAVSYVFGITMLLVVMTQIAGILPSLAVIIGTGLFPGLFWFSRGDISCYMAFYALAVTSGYMFLSNGKVVYGILSGIAAGWLYLCRSDGLYVMVVLTVFIVIFGLKKWKYRTFLCPVGMISVILLFGLVRGGVGDASASRAFDAFYQAEGLLDGKGGSWQDYSRRGLEKFGSPETYDHSMTKLIISNPGEVAGRVCKNLKILRHYVEKSLGLPWVALLIFPAFAISCKLTRRLALLVTFAGLSSGCTYLLFYYQKPYYVIFSVSLAFVIGLGLFGFSNILSELFLKSDRFKRIAIPAASLGILFFLLWEGWMLYRQFPEKNYSSLRRRYWKALEFLEREVAVNGRSFYAESLGGSKSVPIYINSADSGLSDEQIKNKNSSEIAAIMKAKGMDLVVADATSSALWHLAPDFADIVEQGRVTNVRIMEMKHEYD